MTKKESNFIGGINWTYRPKWQLKMFEEFDYSCALSGETDRLTTDHILPRQKGVRRNSKDNIVPLSVSLNSSKGNRNLFVWFKENHIRLNLSRSNFISLIEYLAKQNDMSVEEYRDYYFEEYDKYVAYMKEMRDAKK